MKKKLIAAAPAVAAVGLATLAVLTAAPASAHPAHAYHGNRGHAWTNTDHSRVAIADTRCDNRWAKIILYDIAGRKFGEHRDSNGCRSGYTAVSRWWAGNLGYIQVCVEGRGCGRRIKV